MSEPAVQSYEDRKRYKLDWWADQKSRYDAGLPCAESATRRYDQLARGAKPVRGRPKGSSNRPRAGTRPPVPVSPWNARQREESRLRRLKPDTTKAPPAPRVEIRTPLAASIYIPPPGFLARSLFGVTIHGRR